MRKKIEQYIIHHYETLKENPWDDYPDNSTFKHTDNKKWFALIMPVPYEKLKIEKEGLVDVINLKNIPDMIGGLRKEAGILPAYHMNKEHWITVLLDGTVKYEKVCDLIDLSYNLSSKKQRFLK